MRTLFSFVLAGAMAVTAGCSTTQRVKTETAIAGALISDQDEEALGQQVHQELEKQGIKYSTDQQVTRYVEDLVAKLTPYAQKDRKTNWHVYTIDDAKVVTAFATPGGHIYVYTGLLLAADDEAEVIGVLGHELGHVVARHSARQLVNLYGLQTVLGLALGKDPSTVEKIASSIVANGALLAHSRADENESDVFAVRYSSAAGYDPKGIASFFEKLLASQGKTPRALTWLSTHPATADRIAHVNQVIAEEGFVGSERGAARLAPIKQRLGETPVSAR